MIKLKRTHITAILLLLFVSLAQSINVEPPDLTLIIKKNDTDGVEPVCVAEGNVLNSAIGWIYPLVDTKNVLPDIVSSYIPEIKNDYSCNFAKTKHCTNRWKMQDWQFSNFDSHNFKPTLDTRWEDFPTLLTSNSTKEFTANVIITPVFQIGLSVRAARNAEIFLCEGWNPHNSACYYINIGGTDNKQAFLRKYKVVPDKLSRNDTKLVKYKNDVGILSKDEWKNYALSLDQNGTLQLSEIYKNITLLNYIDKKPLQPISLLIRSKYDTALWKIHKNYYMFTNKTRITQLGPTFELYGSDLCVSLYVSMCNHCKMTFFIMDNDEKKILNEVYNKNEQDNLVWQKVRLLQHNVLDDKIQLFIQTKYTNNTLRNGFWAIDDVRVCAENEIRVTRLLSKINISRDVENAFCQALNVPMWRPPQHTSSSAAVGVVTYTATTPTSIRLYWNTSHTENVESYQEYYIVQYEGRDTCSSDNNSNIFPISKLRQKSKGYAIGRSNEITVKNLIPYTYYNITLRNLIQSSKQSHEINTLATDVPTKEELPKNLSMKITDTTIEVQWDSVKCNETFGPVVYEINTKSKGGSSTAAIKDVKTKYKFEGLLPFTNYSVQIKTSRKLENFYDSNLSIKTIYNFTTLPGIAPRVQNLELYAIDKHSAYFRYDLPTNLQGIPKEVQIQWCHPLYEEGCITEIQNLTRCKLWIEKYCIDINKLIPAYDYKFFVSIKNDKTPAFGKEVNVFGTALERVPGKPANITYEMVQCDKNQDYCHLKVSWSHPYNQNATITMFDIILNGTSYSYVTDTIRSIHDILKIEDRTYQPTYSHVVTYIPFNTPYKISIRAANNAYKGEFASVNIKTDNIDKYLDQTPEYVSSTHETLVFKLPQLDWRLNSSTLIVIVQDYDTKKSHISDEIMKLEMFDNENQLCNNFGETWVAKSMKISNGTTPIIVIGDGTSSYLPQLSKTVVNKPLKSDTEYCFTFTLINQYKNSQNLAVYHKKNLFTETNFIPSPHYNEQLEETTNIAAYLVPTIIVILLLVCGAWFGYRYLKKRKLRNNDVDHVYESMPFDDYIPDAVSNQTYDKLIHDECTGSP